MTLNKEGNYSPWSQPKYGTDAQGASVKPPDGYSLVPEGEEIKTGWLVFDVYAGWMTPDDYNSRNKHHTKSNGRWTAWAKPNAISRGTPRWSGVGAARRQLSRTPNGNERALHNRRSVHEAVLRCAPCGARPSRQPERRRRSWVAHPRGRFRQQNGSTEPVPGCVPKAREPVNAIHS